MKLDAKQTQLLYLLDYNARISLSELNKKLHLSKQNIHYKLKKLQESGVIEKYVAVIDIHKLGYFTFRAYIRLGRVTSKDVKEIVEHLNKDHSILWLVSITGIWDFEIVFVAKDYIEFDMLFRSVKEYLGEKLIKYNLSMSIVNLHYPKDYLLNKKRELKTIAYYGYGPEIRKIDNVDIKLLIELSENCRRSNQEIGQKLGVNYHTVKSRISRLEREGIIQAYRTKLHIQRLGYKHVKAALYLYPHSQEIEIEIMTFISSFSNVTYVVKILGEWEIEIEAEVKNEDQFYEILLEIRNKYPTAINDYYIFEVTREIKLNYFPIGKRLLTK
ncbi:Lrp/AsnC family transcriptional regulator [Candidatus Woesearchaeota archaeon]|nr:Lrp/AsnC family transcriptional regulator [Candidatus Woesearchaeota archaeon]